MKLIKLMVIVIIMAITQTYNAQNKNTNWSGNRPDGHAPISIMGDHYHAKGGLMFSYRYMHMNMTGIKESNNNLPIANLLTSNGGKYMVAPTAMPMCMHMLGVMYAPTNAITLLAMGNVTAMKMDHIMANGNTFTTNSSSFGDLKIGAIFKILNKSKQSLHGQINLSLPTGSIQNKDITPASNGNAVILPYPMQIGSGTLDTNIALTYLGQKDLFSWGNQLTTTVRFGKNDNNYRLGNKYTLNNWLAIKASNYISFSTRISGSFVNGISGKNPDLNPNMIITADTSNSGGNYIYTGFGANFYVPKGDLKNLRLGIEYSNPVYQNVKGTQLKFKETLTIGLQYAL